MIAVNPTPGVDHNTVPSGTTTTWPTDPTTGNPVVPDHTTPGTHPGQIVVHYPDGSTTTLPVPVVVEPEAGSHNPVPKPINVTPGENPANITRPTSEDPTPGVDSSSVPSGSRTIIDPAGPTPDTNTPGSHPVQVIVIYPDGSQSAPIRTTIVVPSPASPSEPTVSEPTEPAEVTPNVEATVSPELIFRDGHKRIIGTLNGKLTGYEGERIPLKTLKKLVKKYMPKGYLLDMNLDKAWKEGKLVFSAKHPVYIKIARAHRQMILFVDKRGRIVKRVYVMVKNKQQFTKKFVKSLANKHLPRHYKMTGYRKVAKHLDIFVSGKKTKPTSHGKLVLYVRKGGKIVKRAYVDLTHHVFSKRNAKMHLPKGYQMTGHTHINRHNDVWVVKKHKAHK